MRGRLQVGMAHIFAVSAATPLNQRKFLSIFFRMALGSKTVVIAVRKMEAGVPSEWSRALIIFVFICFFCFYLFFCFSRFFVVFFVFSRFYRCFLRFHLIFLIFFVFFCLKTFLNVFFCFLRLLDFWVFVCDYCCRIINLESRGNGWRPNFKMRLWKVDRQMQTPRVWVERSFTGWLNRRRANNARAL